MKPFDVYKSYLGLKNHFTKKTYDYHRYCGKSRASLQSFYKRRDRFFFEKLSRQKSDDEIKAYFVANFVGCTDPESLWIGEIIRNGEDVYTNWLKKIQSLYYTFKTEVEIFIHKENFSSLFSCKKGRHPEILKKYLEGAINLETMVILDMILNYSDNFDKKLDDPVWETVSLRIFKYKPFLNIDIAKYKKLMQEIIL